jgi:hypothetical protein
VVALVDLVFAAMAAIPSTSAALVGLVYRIDALLELGTPPIVPGPSLTLAINLAGLLALLSAAGRLADQTLMAARLDVWRRLLVAAVVSYYVLARGQTPVLLAFAAVELVIGVLQGYAARRFARTTGAA